MKVVYKYPGKRIAFKDLPYKTVFCADDCPTSLYMKIYSSGGGHIQVKTDGNAISFSGGYVIFVEPETIVTVVDGSFVIDNHDGNFIANGREQKQPSPEHSEQKDKPKPLVYNDPWESATVPPFAVTPNNSEKKEAVNNPSLYM